MPVVGALDWLPRSPGGAVSESLKKKGGETVTFPVPRLWEGSGGSRRYSGFVSFFRGMFIFFLLCI